MRMTTTQHIEVFLATFKVGCDCWVRSYWQLVFTAQSPVTPNKRLSGKMLHKIPFCGRCHRPSQEECLYFDASLTLLIINELQPKELVVEGEWPLSWSCYGLVLMSSYIFLWSSDWRRHMLTTGASCENFALSLCATCRCCQLQLAERLIKRHVHASISLNLNHLFFFIFHIYSILSITSSKTDDHSS